MPKPKITLKLPELTAQERLKNFAIQTAKAAVRAATAGRAPKSNS